MAGEIEVFHCDCPCCTETVTLLRKARAPEGTSLTFRRMADNPEHNMAKAKEYGFAACPNVVVDGSWVIKGQVPTREEVSSVLGLKV